MMRVYDSEPMKSYKEEIIAYIKDVMEINKETIRDKNKISNKKIIESLKRRFGNLKIGKNVNTAGIRNNACYALIDREKCERIFGYLHLTDDMFGGILFFLSNIDDIRTTEIIKIRP